MAICDSLLYKIEGEISFPFSLSKCALRGSIMQQPMNLEAWKTTALRYGRLKIDPILRAVLPRNQVGCLVGFGGQTSQHLQNTHNVLLQFFSVENARWGRLMSIKGSPSNQGKAWYECAILLLKQYYDNYKEVYHPNLLFKYLTFE